MNTYLFRYGNGNEGNYPICLIEIEDGWDTHAALAALVVNMYVPGPRRAYLQENIEVDGDDQNVYAAVYEGPNGENAFGSAWITAELELLNYKDAAYYSKSLDLVEPATELDQEAMDFYEKSKQ